MRFPASLLWFDCTGGLVVGAFVLAFAKWLSALYALPLTLVVTMGAANVAYGAFSLSLARRAQRPSALLHLLIFANLAWALLCLFAAFAYAQEASIFGTGQLLLESVVVGGLGVLEWRHRRELLLAR